MRNGPDQLGGFDGTHGFFLKTSARFDHFWWLDLSVGPHSGYDAVVLAVAHAEYLADGGALPRAALRDGGVFIDVKSALSPESFAGRGHYWSL